jgi:O-antigen/teichoic acid export membrane protein
MSCATLIYANLDIVMLGFMGDAEQVGYYQIATKIKVALTAVGGIVWNVALPKATQLWERGDHEGFAQLARRSLRFVCLLQLAVTLFFMVSAGWVIPLVAGKDYAPAVPSFRVLLLSLLPIAASNIIGEQLLIPAGKEKRLLAAELAGAGANLILNLVLIPTCGIVGAAAATVAAECVVTLLAYWYARKDLHVALLR